ncbi:phage virion morphogenesis protein [Ruegeria sp.]|uniref:phage virion morphogenesis protein n=1 Tax=Ruegeria sp. TaxID=1879320 RepID=UPI003B5B1A1E
MMARIAVEMDDSQIAGALGRLQDRLSDLTPVMEAIGARLEASTARRFEQATGPDGQPWQPSRRAQETGGLTLTDTARLRRSITTRVGRDSVEIGSNLVYAAIHQFGGTIKQDARRQVLAFDRRGRFASRRSTARRRAGVVPIAIADIAAREITMPARPYLGLDDGDRTAILRILRDALEAGS